MKVLALALPALLALPASAAPKSTPHDRQVARGKYLVTVAGCNDCHTPLKMGPQGPEPDMTRMLSGHPQGMTLAAASSLGAGWMFQGSHTMTAFAGPWGISYAPNLTPDEATGILAPFTEELFIRTMRTGRHMGTSRPIMPPMPWQNLSRATDEDLKAIFAFLRSVPPVRNAVPDYEPPAAPKLAEKR